MGEQPLTLTNAPADPVAPVSRKRKNFLPAWAKIFLGNRKAATGLAILTFFIGVAIFSPTRFLPSGNTSPRIPLQAFERCNS